MTQESSRENIIGGYSIRQVLFNRYLTAVLVDLTVLNLFDEYWNLVVIGSFTISLLAAVLLQVMLKVTLVIEHRVANFFNARPGSGAKAMRLLSAWFILFVSKIVILEAINFFFGDRVLFAGPLHGLVSFITVVFVLLAAEYLLKRIFLSLANSPAEGSSKSRA